MDPGLRVSLLLIPTANLEAINTQFGTQLSRRRLQAADLGAESTGSTTSRQPLSSNPVGTDVPVQRRKLAQATDSASTDDYESYDESWGYDAAAAENGSSGPANVSLWNTSVLPAYSTTYDYPTWDDYGTSWWPDVPGLGEEPHEEPASQQLPPFGLNISILPLPGYEAYSATQDLWQDIIAAGNGVTTSAGRE